MLASIAVVCCVIVPVVFAAIVGLVSVVVKEVNQQGDKTLLYKILWNSPTKR